MNSNTYNSPTSGAKTIPSSKTTLHRKMLSLAIIQALACGSGALNAATITVGDATDTSTASNCTLRDALEAANTDAVVGTCTAGSGTDTINFDNTLSGSTVTLGGTALDINSDLTIDGDIDDDGTADITVSGNDASRVFVIDAVTSNKAVTLEGLTISNGDAPVTSPGDFDSGGGIFCQSGNSTNACNLIVSNSTITNNVGSASGGGIGGRNSGYLNITLTNSTVSNNTATRYVGGGIHTTKGDVTLTDSTISGNTSYGSGGGVSAGEGEVTLTNSTISGNVTEEYGYGGGIFSEEGNVTMTDSTVSMNTSYYGAGISTVSGNVSLTGSTISDNTGTNKAGGIYTSDGNISLINSTISGNDITSGDGGGIYARNGDVSLTNSTISGNTAASNGGGIFARSFSGISVTLTNSTIVNNTATGGGGGLYFKFAPGVFNMVNTILANNTGGDCETDVTFTPDTDTNNLEISSSGDCGIVPISTADPDLNALADNGGPTLTHLPNVGSPVIDAGDNTNCGAGLTITTDQRGVARDDGMCDIGAVEGPTPPLVVASVQLDSTTATVSEDGSSITLNLTRSGDTVSAVSINYNTSDGTATAPGDYTADTNTLNFATGITSQSVTINITDDSDVESDENFTLALSNAQLVSGTASVELGANAAATVTITDDDSSSSSSTLGLSPWWSMLILTAWLRRRFGS